ncbi:hypothetical protein JRI60_02115 [Archangium violaceum]|uniref:hypothetical protein n=1 Tax=Archangium violaceum TaxID=83451 RepID=UPI00194F69B3|nr:hypothetical protein [Archangium violaceum]QRN97901.1 hypothetical protein JRI60_02115 [Archangium violaceum]
MPFREEMLVSLASQPQAPGNESSSVLLDESLWPLVVVRIGRTVTTEDFEAYLSTRSAYLRREEPHLCIFDARQVHMPTAQMRQRYTDWLRDNALQLRHWMLGSAYIIESPAVRMMMSVIRHFAAMTTPFVVTATLTPAVSWAAERFQEAGLTQAATRIRVHYALPSS